MRPPPPAPRLKPLPYRSHLSPLSPICLITRRSRPRVRYCQRRSSVLSASATFTAGASRHLLRVPTVPRPLLFAESQDQIAVALTISRAGSQDKELLTLSSLAWPPHRPLDVRA